MSRATFSAAPNRLYWIAKREISPQYGQDQLGELLIAQSSVRGLAEAPSHLRYKSAIRQVMQRKLPIWKMRSARA